MASNQGESDQSIGRGSRAQGGESTGDQKHSQTLPLITEELAAGQSTSASPSTRSVTTPVMPPNPIRREGVSRSQTRSEAPPAAQNPHTSRAPSTSSTVRESLSEASSESGAPEAGEKKSGSGISATQLIAGAGAAATSSVIGGQLGVAGTVVGAGVASIVTGLAVTLYSRSLDKGKEKIKVVGQKLAPAVKAQTEAKRRRAGKTMTAAESVDDREYGAASAGEDASTVVLGDDEPRSWWQKLRRKRVLYPLTIAVAAFGIGLGGVVMAEFFTEADISPGTSEISRSVSGNSGESGAGDQSGTSHDGSGSSSGDSSGSQPGEGSEQADGSESSTTGEGSSSTGSESGSDSSGSTDPTGSEQSTDAGADSSSSSSNSNGLSSAGADGSGSSGASSGSSSSQGDSGSGGSGTGSGSDGGAAGAQG